MKRYTRYLLGVLMFGWIGCSSESLDDYRSQGTAPSVQTGEVVLKDYTLTVDGVITGNGGSPVLEAGICYNEVEYGTPSHENEKTKFVALTGNHDSFSISALLMPEREYTVSTYAVNAFGKNYGQTQTVRTGELDYNLLLPGTYVTDSLMSYYNWMTTRQGYERYEVTVRYDNGKLWIESLGCAPKGWVPSQVSLEMSLTHVVTDTTDYHELTVPLQLTQLQAQQADKIYPVLFLSSYWMMEGESTDEKDVKGKLEIGDDVVLNLESGFCFAVCDPLTHEINVDTAPLELILGPTCFEVTDEELLKKLPTCRLTKIK